MSIRSNPLSPMTPCLIQQILTSNKGIANQSCASASRKFEIQLTRYLTVELLMCYFQDTCFEVVNVAVGKKKARCWRNEVYAEDRAHPVLPLSRLANLLDTEFIWENGEALMQCRDKGHWRTVTKFEIRNSTAYASQMQFEVLRRALWVQQAKHQTVFDWKF